MTVQLKSERGTLSASAAAPGDPGGASNALAASGSRWRTVMDLATVTTAGGEARAPALRRAADAAQGDAGLLNRNSPGSRATPQSPEGGSCRRASGPRQRSHLARRAVCASAHVHQREPRRRASSSKRVTLLWESVGIEPSGCVVAHSMPSSPLGRMTNTDASPASMLSPAKVQERKAAWQEAVAASPDKRASHNNVAFINKVCANSTQGRRHSALRR